MLPHLKSILADSTESGLIKVALFVVFIVVNLVVSAVKNSKKNAQQVASEKQLSPPPLPPVLPNGPSPNMPFKTIGAEVAARRARMMSSDPRAVANVTRRPLQEALTDAIKLAQAAKRASAQPRSAPLRQQPPRQPSRQPARPPAAPLINQQPEPTFQRVTATAASISDSTRSMRPDISESEIRSVSNTPAAVMKVADAASIRRWLTPMTMKQQFMLTEVLQAPVALRPSVLEG